MQVDPEDVREAPGNASSFLRRRPRTFAATLFLLGIFTGLSVSVPFYAIRSMGVRVYEDGNYCIAYHADWPTYGLPLPEYSSTYTLLEHGEYERAKERLKGFYDRALQDARNRLKIAPQADRKAISEAITVSARFMASAEDAPHTSANEEPHSRNGAGPTQSTGE